MKRLFTIGVFATLAIIVAVPPAFAQSPTVNAPEASPAGNYEWKHQPRLGPNKSRLPSFRRVRMGGPQETSATKPPVNSPACLGAMQTKHHEWRKSPQKRRGPRAPKRAPVRVEVTPHCP